MLKNYLKIALRNLFRHKSYSFINIAGLAIGMACCLVIFLYVRASLSYDTQHYSADDVYRVVGEDRKGERERWMTLTAPMLAPTLIKTFPEVEKAAHMIYLPGAMLVEHQNKRFFEERIYLADSAILQILNIPMVYGDARTALNKAGSVIITEEIALKYFGPGNPIGKVLTLDKQMATTVMGVMAKPKTPTHTNASIIGSFSFARSIFGKRLQSWSWSQFYTYLRLKENTSATDFEAKLENYIAKEINPVLGEDGADFRFHLQPVKHIYLRSGNLEYDQPNRGNINFVYAFTIIAVFILVIACFNFMNLATARSLRRAKEVGVRKVVGAHKSQLITQYLGESILMTLLAFVLAIPLVELALPFFNQLSGESLRLHLGKDILIVVGLLVFSIPVGLLAGLYPAFFLSGFLPIDVLKSNNTGKGFGLSVLRQGLVVAQFVISVVLIAATAVVYQQLNYLRNKNLGFDKEQTLVFKMEGDRLQQAYEQFKTEILRSPAVVAAAASYGEPGGMVAGDGIKLTPDGEQKSMNMFTVDYDYIPTLKFKMAAGRPFDKKYKTDEQQAFIINETAAKELGFANSEKALGQDVYWDEWLAEGKVKKGKVIGVVKDFHIKSIHQKIEPFTMHVYPGTFGWLTVRIQADQVPEALAHLEKTWNTFAPGYPFQYNFLDDYFNKMIEAERKLSLIFTIFAGLAIFIACLGLLGLVAFSAQQRTKEIGIRKVMGASVPQIMVLLSKDFTKLVLIAIIIATPIAWYGMNYWLRDFAYRITINPLVFIVSGLIALLITLFTVSFLTRKAAISNPVKSLRSE